MNWTTLLKFRKQVEDLAREAVVLAEWEKSQEQAKYDDLHQELHHVGFDLEQRLRQGLDTRLAEERYRWIEALGDHLEKHHQTIQAIDQKLKLLRQKLKHAHRTRRVVELIIAKKEDEVLKTMSKREQQLHDEITSHAYSMRNHEEIAQ